MKVIAFFLIAGAIFCPPAGVSAQITYQRLLDAGKDPANWLTYSGRYQSWRYSDLNQITPANAAMGLSDADHADSGEHADCCRRHYVCN
jgi:glucose dehydrogenase